MRVTYTWKLNSGKWKPWYHALLVFANVLGGMCISDLRLEDSITTIGSELKYIFLCEQCRGLY